MPLDLTPQEVVQRAADAAKWWRMKSWKERTCRELELAMQRHGLTPIDARAYARDAIAGMEDLKAFSIGLTKLYALPSDNIVFGDTIQVALLSAEREAQQ